MQAHDKDSILTIAEDGAVRCKLSVNSSFVCFGVPVRVEGQGEGVETMIGYQIGSFAGRHIPLSLRPGLRTILRFRIPLELFRPRERLTVSIVACRASGPPEVLWAKHWEASWLGAAPSLEPLAE